MDIVVIGGGYAGIAAAVQAARMGARVRLLERSETLLGTGQVGGIFGNNGRRTLELECRCMGADTLWERLDTVRLHGDVDLPAICRIIRNSDYGSFRLVLPQQPQIKRQYNSKYRNFSKAHYRRT